MLSILVTANHVLDHFGLVNGFGHVSVRDPGDPSRFYMTGHAPPRFVQSSDDLYHYTVVDGSPAAGGSAGTSPWSERFVHQGIYKRYAEVKSVVDSHSQVVVAAGVSGVPMRAAYHMAGFVGSHDVPNFDASSCYGSDQKRNMLINDVKLGEGLASALDGTDMLQRVPTSKLPLHALVLQRGHSFTTCSGVFQYGWRTDDRTLDNQGANRARSR